MTLYTDTTKPSSIHHVSLVNLTTAQFGMNSSPIKEPEGSLPHS